MKTFLKILWKGLKVLLVFLPLEEFWICDSEALAPPTTVDQLKIIWHGDDYS